MAADGATTWILTASPDDRGATADHGFTGAPPAAPVAPVRGIAA